MPRNPEDFKYIVGPAGQLLHVAKSHQHSRQRVAAGWRDATDAEVTAKFAKAARADAESAAKAKADEARVRAEQDARDKAAAKAAADNKA